MYVEEIYPRASAANEHLATTEGENCGYSLTLLLGFTVTPIHRIPTLGRLKKPELRKMPISGTVWSPLLTQKSPNCVYISQKPW